MHLWTVDSCPDPYGCLHVHFLLQRWGPLHPRSPATRSPTQQQVSSGMDTTRDGAADAVCAWVTAVACLHHNHMLVDRSSLNRQTVDAV